MSTGELPIDRRWKFPLIPSIVTKEITRAASSDIDMLGSVYVPDLCDVIGGMYTVKGISSIFDPAIPVIGSAVTVKCPPGDNFGLRVALTLTSPGDVLVVDAQGFDDWCLGGFQMLTTAIRARGLKGLVVNGAYRDRAEAMEAKFPVYAKAVAAWSGPKLGPLEINVPVCCGGVIVHPGDVISASGEGIAIVPKRHAGLVARHFESMKSGAASDMAAKLAAQERAMLQYLESIAETGRLEATG